MRPLKIGIIEDEFITAEDLSAMLRECGYSVAKPAARYSEAIAMIESESPDLLLLDINIPGKMDGIEVGRTVEKAFGIPFIFLTANSDYPTIARAKEVGPAAFLTKPVSKAQLFAAIEIAMASTGSAKGHSSAAAAPTTLSPQYLFVNDGRAFIKVAHDEILFAESEENYVRLHLMGGKTVMVRTTFTDFITGLNTKRFVRVHRCYAVATDKIAKALPEEVMVGTHRIPLSRTYRAEVMTALGIR